MSVADGDPARPERCQVVIVAMPAATGHRAAARAEHADDPDPAVATVADQLAADGLPPADARMYADGIVAALHRGGHLAAACDCPTLGHLPGRCSRAEVDGG